MLLTQWVVVAMIRSHHMLWLYLWISLCGALLTTEPTEP